jgi:hypothetical protein
MGVGVDRGIEGECGLALIGGTRLSARAGACGLAGPGWAGWAEMEFSFFLIFEMLSFLFSLGNSNQIQPQFKFK